MVTPAETATAEEKAAFDKLKKESNDVTCLMLACMDANLQKQFEDWDAYKINAMLKKMFQEQERIERFNTLKELVNCKMPNGCMWSNEHRGKRRLSVLHHFHGRL